MYKTSRGSLVVISMREWTGHQPQESQLLVFIIVRWPSNEGYGREPYQYWWVFARLNVCPGGARCMTEGEAVFARV